MKTACITVVVPSYNSKGTILDCLDSLSAQCGGADVEVIVVDSSADGTASLVRERHPSVTLVHREGRLLPGAARNLGVEHSRGAVLAFIDADCVAHRDWLRSLVGSLEDGCRLVGGSVGVMGQPSAIEVADYILTFNEFSPAMPARSVAGLPGANLACTREFFLEAGGFSPSLAAGEDLVFTFEASRRTAVAFRPAAVVYHKNRGTMRSFLVHHYHFGVHSAWVRRSHPLPGYRLARIPPLSVAAPILRAARIVTRAARHDRDLLVRLARTFPLVALGIASWGLGFVRSSLAADGAPPGNAPTARTSRQGYQS